MAQHKVREEPRELEACDAEALKAKWRALRGADRRRELSH